MYPVFVLTLPLLCCKITPLCCEQLCGGSDGRRRQLRAGDTGFYEIVRCVLNAGVEGEGGAVAATTPKAESAALLTELEEACDCLEEAGEKRETRGKSGGGGVHLLAKRGDVKELERRFLVLENLMNETRVRGRGDKWRPMLYLQRHFSCICNS